MIIHYVFAISLALLMLQALYMRFVSRLKLVWFIVPLLTVFASGALVLVRILGRIA